jgi:hypothetical protein
MKRLRVFADKINFEIELDPKELQTTIEAGFKNENGDYVIFPNKINDDPSITTKSPYEYSKCITYFNAMSETVFTSTYTISSSFRALQNR